MNILTITELEQMTVKEIAGHARIIMATHSVDEAKEMLSDHIKVANKKMKEFSDRLNKTMGTRKSAPKINVISDFNRFRL